MKGIVIIYNLDGTTEEYNCKNIFQSMVGYTLELDDETSFVVSPSSVNKLRIKIIKED